MTETLWTRRLLIQTFAASAAGLAAPNSVAAQSQIPTVDRLDVQFVVDGSVFGFQQELRRPGLFVEPPARTSSFEQRLVAEWGLSLLLDSHTAGRPVNRILFDFGYSASTLVNNMGILGIDPESIDALVLSHGHYDHFGGLAGLLSSGRLRPGLPLHIGGAEAFCRRRRGLQGDLDFGSIDREALALAGVVPRVGSQPVAVGGGITTGTIPLAIERPRTPTRMVPGDGCARDELDPDKRNLLIVEDDSRHELGLAFNVAGLGLVVLGACSHRGILNTIRRAQDVTRVTKVHAVVGGFHLVPPQTPRDAAETAAALARIDPQVVVPGHCSGETFIASAEAAMPGKTIRPYVGTKFIFSKSA